MADWLWFGRLHRSTYRATGGIVGGNLIGRPVLLLTTTGRKSGLPRTAPLPFLQQGEDRIIVGSNNAGPRDPMWWLNLKAEPRAEIQVRRERFQVSARLAEPEERARLWPILVEFNPPYASYAAKTNREIPVVILSPVPTTKLETEG